MVAPVASPMVVGTLSMYGVAAVHRPVARSVQKNYKWVQVETTYIPLAGRSKFSLDDV